MQNTKAYELLLLIAGGAGAITGIAAFILKVVKTIRRIVAWFTNLDKRLDEIEKHTRENWLQCLKLTIVNDDIPIEERLRAGEDYVAGDGNGEIKAHYKLLQKEYAAQHKGVKM